MTTLPLSFWWHPIQAMQCDILTLHRWLAGKESPGEAIAGLCLLITSDYLGQTHGSWRPELPYVRVCSMNVKVTQDQQPGRLHHHVKDQLQKGNCQRAPTEFLYFTGSLTPVYRHSKLGGCQTRHLASTILFWLTMQWLHLPGLQVLLILHHKTWREYWEKNNSSLLIQLCHDTSQVNYNKIMKLYGTFAHSWVVVDWALNFLTLPNSRSKYDGAQHFATIALKLC